MREVHFYVTGRVQGVGYRAWCVKTALKLNLSGWVRNRFDGSVEVQAKGEELFISEFLKACQKGPAWAHVTALTPITIPTAFLPLIEEGRFSQQPTV